MLDHVILYRSEKDIASLQDINDYLLEDLRIDWKDLQKAISHEVLEQLRPFYYRRRSARLLIDCLMQKKQGKS